MKNFITTPLLVLIGAVLGFFTVLVLPFLFLIALQQFIMAIREPYNLFAPIDLPPLPHRCGGGAQCKSCPRLAVYADQRAGAVRYWCEFHAPMNAEPLFIEAARWN